jgi:hypothetical protein
LNPGYEPKLFHELKVSMRRNPEAKLYGVEPQGEDRLQLLPNRGFVGSAVSELGVPTLVEETPHKERVSIQKDLLIFQF